MIAQTDIRIFTIGDPDQCIYEELSGTRPEYITELAGQVKERDQSESIRLIHNYRCAQRLIDVSEKVLGKKLDYQALEDGGTCDCYECENEGEQQKLLLERILPLLTNAADGDSLRPEDIAILHPWRRGGINIISSKLDDFEGRWPHTLDKDVDYNSTLSETLRWLEQMAQWCLYGWRSGDPYFRDLLPFWIKLNTDPDSQILRDSRLALQLKLFEILWDLRQIEKPMYFRDWLYIVMGQLDLQNLLTIYEIVAPDDVGEFNRLVENLEGERLSCWSLSRFAKGPGRIQLTTFHSGKGTQFKAVIIMGLDKLEKLLSTGSSVQRQRLAYVAVTRAKSRVFILYEGFPQTLQELSMNRPTGCTFWQRYLAGSGQVSWQPRPFQPSLF